MSFLLQNLSVVDQDSKVNKTKVNILVKDGIIKSFDSVIADEKIDFDGCIVTPGWIDLDSNFNDPGFEHKEDLLSGSKCAAASGFTDICLVPDTNPVVESKSDISYLKRDVYNGVDLHPIGAVSENNQGENLTEIFDLYNAGAVGFSSGDLPIWNSELLIKALEYTTPLKVPVIQNARDIHLSRGTHMHEGFLSTKLGLRGEPRVSEEVSIRRDLELLKYSGGQLHFSKITTASAVPIIRKAKEEGLKVTCDVSIHHLLFTDENVRDFDANMKNLPPYRSEQDRQALLSGLIDGTIDSICSNHRPQDPESKELEFDLADPGSISLQTFYPSLLRVAESVPFEVLIDKVTNGSRRVLGLEEQHINIGSLAKLTILNPDEKWVLDNQTNLSKSSNSPFWNQQLKGCVKGVVNGNRFLTF